MKINWFSPLSPARTDIAHYTWRVLKPLSELAEITLWSDHPKWDPSLEQFASVRYYDPSNIDWRALNSGDVTFYHMGNNVLFHGAIWQVSLRHPGIVVLHDFRFHHFFVEYFCSQGNRPKLYLDEVEQEYGNHARTEAENLLRVRLKGIDQMAERYPMTNLVLRNSIAALVHSREPFAQLKDENKFPVAYAPLPYSLSVAPYTDQFKGNGNRLDDRIRLIVFGYLAPNRRLDVVLEVLASLPEVDRFVLDIYGELWDKPKIEDSISRLGLKRHVTVRGFVAEDELDHALSSSDLAINLRFPTMGEASGSQLRCWSNGLPSIVTKIGWYATLPADTVAYVRPEFEIEDLTLHLRDILRDPAKFRGMGQRGRRLLQDTHSPKQYARTIVDLCNHAPSFRVQAAASKWAERTGERLAQLGSITARSASSRHAAEQIFKCSGLLKD
ncbi:MAG: hypothetical protein QOH96_4295 [Blastocatellia bacterium]|jgi:glycosyltransferase involved in cell wall biosynthesis|nr:hypothetical protein [Blastocatellia bacterium]